MTHHTCSATDLSRPGESRPQRLLRRLWRLYRAFWLEDAERRTLVRHFDALDRLDARLLGDIGAPHVFVAWRELRRQREAVPGRPWRGE